MQNSTSSQGSKSLLNPLIPVEPLAGNAILQAAVSPVEVAVSSGLQALERMLLERLEQGLRELPLRIGGVEVLLSVQRAERMWTLRLAAGGPMLLPDLAGLVELTGGTASELPADLAQLTQVELSDVEVLYDITARQLTVARFTAAARNPWSLSALPGVSLEQLRLQLEVRTPTSRPQLFVTLTGVLRLGGRTFPIHAERKDGHWIFSTPPLQDVSTTLRQLAQQLLLEGFELPDVIPNLPLSGLRLSADLDAKQLTLSSTTTGHVNFGALRFESQGFEVRLWSQSEASAPHRTGLSWRVALKGAMTLPDSLDVQGELTLSRTGVDQSALAFEPQQAEVTLPLPIPHHSASVVLRLGATGFTSTQQGWQLESSASVGFSGLPAFLQKHLPERTLGTLRATQDSVTLTLDRLLKAVQIELPNIHLKGTTPVPLGELLLDATDFSLELDGDPRFSVMLALSLPSTLNNLLGTKPDGTPRVAFLRTAPEMQRLRLSATAEGVKLSPLTSPLTALSFEQEDGVAWAYLRMKEFGEARCQVPEFSYDAATSSLRASGAFKVMKPLRLPLRLFKNALVAAHRKNIADRLPDYLPLTEFKPFGADGKLDGATFIGRLEQLLGRALPQEVRDILRMVGQRINELPDRFRSYLGIEAPDELSFDISITADGGAQIDVKAPGDKPLRVLFPSPQNVFQLIGVELRSFSFGPIFSGALCLLKVDARVDTFELVTLAATLAGVPQELGLPPSTSFQTTVNLNNLLMLLCLQTEVPFPIPLSFDELGLVHTGLEGARFETKLGLPLPGFNLAEGLQLSQEVARFVTERDYLFNTGSALQNMKLQMSAGPTYLQLPPYLGGKVLGSKDKVVKIDLIDKTATVLNTLKTGHLADLVAVIPFAHRSGQVPVKIGPLETEAAWLLTTREEFQTLSHEQLGVLKAASAEVLSVVPADGAQSAKGLVALMKGHGTLGGLKVDSVLGLAPASSGGLLTGFRSMGTVPGLGSLELSGQVGVPFTVEELTAGTSARGPVQLTGWLALLLADGTRVFEGQVSSGGDVMSVLGKLDLFPHSPRLRIAGQLSGRISPRELALSGSISLTIGKVLNLASASAEISQHRLRISGECFGQAVSFVARKAETGLQLEAAMSPVSVGEVLRITDASGQSGPSAVLKVGSDGAPRLTLEGAVDLLGFSQTTRVDLSEQGIEFEASGKLFNQFQGTVKVRGESLSDSAGLTVQATMRGELTAFLQEKAVQIIQSVTDGATRELNAAIREVDKAQAEVNRLQGERSRMRAAIQADRDRDLQRLAAAQQELNKAQAEVNRLNGEIDRMRATIQADRNRDLQRLAAAQQEVNKAQAEVNRLNGEINHVRGVIEGERRGVQNKLASARADLDGAQRKVDQIRGELEATKRWYNSLPRVALPNKPSQMREAVPYAAKMGALNAALATATAALDLCKRLVEGLQKAANLPSVDLDPRLVGLFAARDVATGALNVAQAALASIQKVINNTSIDLDPRLVGLFAAREVATGVLKAAQAALAAIQNGINNTSIDLDPRLVVLAAAWEVATAALKLANEALEKLKAAVGSVAEVGAYIARSGLGTLLNVRSVSFETSLNTARGAKVTLQAEVLFMGRARSVSFAHDFNNLLESAHSLARTLLPAR